MTIIKNFQLQHLTRNEVRKPLSGPVHTLPSGIDMAASQATTPSLGEYPPAVDLRAMMRAHPLPVISEEMIDETVMTGDEPTKQALVVLGSLNAALVNADVEALRRCFFPGQAYWKDSLALTWHLRTFKTPGGIAASLMQTTKLRGMLEDIIRLDGEAQFVPATPVLQFIDGNLTFTTRSPAAACKGRMLLLPAANDGRVEWKIWILSTYVEELEQHPENELMLQSPGRQLEGLEKFETNVFIIGGGNAAITLAARLKALGVDSVMAERNAKPGDNWALRYDCMRFHIPTSCCEMPYMSYAQELQTPHLLSRDELVEQVRRYVKTFNLNMITSARIQSTVYDKSEKRWVVKFQTPGGQKTAFAKHLVQATGFGSQEPYLPPMKDAGLYQGISVHSQHFKSGTALAEKGIKSVLVIGSANTAFDVLEDCHAAGLNATMVVRSPTYIVPIEYVRDRRAIGAYDLGGVDRMDRLLMTMPTWVDGQLLRGLLGQMAWQEPDRYSALAAAGFPVVDSRDPEASLTHHLLERAGGHYVDVGGTKLISEGKVGLKAGVEPVAYTATGLRFSDGSSMDADAVVWCTGFADKNARETAAKILGGGLGTSNGAGNRADVLGPDEIASRLDATLGVDAEGEIRGMWKRHLCISNFWIMGGHTQQHRWHSQTLALQIKAELEGILPPAYRETSELGKVRNRLSGGN
ncbi:FAD/NAD(P)-binding domain-containing protein [Parathielavia appendiculata]|uniref:FAD/NAD(P)-binding domain-containing protein n=1 Tax=Parathielavia appendiculata TaxID=2587402 RepID=A0AAN6Z4R7_9PEZI|nr:FAD/NAD(P)-binding domain-containing protein [Parathielavia appendiculata]